MKDHKTIKLLGISLSLLIFLSACNLTNTTGLQTTSSMSPVPSLTLQSSPTLMKTNTLPPTSTIKVVTASPTTPSTSTSTTTSTATATSIPPVTMSWKAYTYTCAFASGGTTMTMNLTWSDPSNSEDGYRVYRDNIAIATLAPNTTTYTDVTFIPAGNTVSYYVEVFSKDWQVSTSTIVYGCQ